MCYGIVKIHFINHSFNIYNIQQPTRIEGTDIYNIQYIYTHTHSHTNEYGIWFIEIIPFGQKKRCT